MNNRITKPIATALIQSGIDPTIERSQLLIALKYTDKGNARKVLGRGMKTDKGLKQGVETFIVYLAASNRAGINVCAMSGNCATACLGFNTGMLRFTPNQKAQTLKTLWFHLFKDDFIATLKGEIVRKYTLAKLHGNKCAIRLNGSSDIIWERHLNMAEFPDIQFYDYTKHRASTRSNRAPNYHLTFSLDEKPNAQTYANEWLAMGGNVAMVVAGMGSKLSDAKQATQTLVASGWRGYPVIDGDLNDIRFDDLPGHWVALYAKGTPALHDTSGFIQRIGGE